MSDHARVKRVDMKNHVTIGGVSRDGVAYPKKISGYFLGTIKYTDQNKVDPEKNPEGSAFKHRFLTSEGEKVVWGKTDLNAEMRACTVGHHTILEQVGIEKIKGTNFTKLKYEASQSPTDKINVEEYDSNGGLGTTATFDDEGDTALDADDVSLDEPRPTRPSAPAIVSQTNAERAKALAKTARKSV